MYKKPKITVVTPTYNRAGFIAETIRSVLNQSFRDFEYYILDDGSTDNTKQVVELFLSDSRIKYLRRENTGEPETVNWGWSLSQGEYFVQVNSDDPILPGLFKKMVNFLDKNEKIVVGYPDFIIIDANSKTIIQKPNVSWNFEGALKNFSCDAATPGMFIRKSAFLDWKIIRKNNYKHINDIEMLWDMALVGEFAYVSGYLATWRSHGGAISSNRWQSIPEIERWYKSYFSRKNLPVNIKKCRKFTRIAIYRYFIMLLEKESIGNYNKEIYAYKAKIGQGNFKFNNLQVGDNDLIGNKFNGHDLHNYLRERNIESNHLVWNKLSKDKNTYLIAGHRDDRTSIQSNALQVQKKYQINSFQNPLVFDILYNQLFLRSNIVHYHLINNNIFDLSLLPLMTRLKPTVWSIHDPWSLGGHCVYHFDCIKWQTQCADCPYLNTHFSLEKDNSALNFDLKKSVIQNSKLDIIVASKWMENKVRLSPMFVNAKIHLIPFGINQDIFKLRNKKICRKNLHIPLDSFVITFRHDESKFKGLEYIHKALESLTTKKKIFLIVIANKLKNNPRKYPHIDFQWVNDDKLLSEIYNASDLFLMPSTMEAFGMMSIEAMSCGVLPIVISGTALSEVVNAPECGIASSRSIEDYSRTVEYYVNHDQERILHAKKCRNFAMHHYNKDRYVSDIARVYKEVIARHSITEYDRNILLQLKKNMTQPADLSNSTFKNEFDIIRIWFLRHFYRVTAKFPRAIRYKIKQELWKHNSLRNFFTID
jgi:glycosyltransferase involved in cell wall biosynthesis